ncbi:phosphinothricin acetyltransferase [Burkholderiales bacterium]|nr:phosphinothricin acetyltransferase [Burkholderiales bacterium]
MIGGITIRRATTADAGSLARLRIEAWRQSYKGFVPQASLDAMSVEASLPLWQRALAAPGERASVFVAEGDAGVLGFAAGNVLVEPRHGCDAELTAIYLAREVQRRGLGRRLVGTVASERAAHGAAGMIAWTLAGIAPARRFLEALGADLVIEQPFEWDGAPLVEAGYRWLDLPSLVERAGIRSLH